MGVLECREAMLWAKKSALGVFLCAWLLVPIRMLAARVWLRNHLEERLLDQAQAWVSYTPPPFWGHSRSIPQGMTLDVQPFVKSLFCPIRQSPNEFFVSVASIP